MCVLFVHLLCKRKKNKPEKDKWFCYMLMNLQQSLKNLDHVSPTLISETLYTDFVLLFCCCCCCCLFIYFRKFVTLGGNNRKGHRKVNLKCCLYLGKWKSNVKMELSH